MKARTLFGASLASLLIFSGAIHAADGDKPEPKVDTSRTRLVKPFSELNDLTTDQTEKLKVIHRKYLDELKALESKQHEDFLAVLTDAQKKEVSEIEAKDRADRKAAGKKMKEGDPKGAAAGGDNKGAGDPKDPAKEAK